MAVDNRKIAEGVLDAVGGTGNIASATHCMTRLRLTIKEKDAVDEAKVKAVKGVLGLKWVGDQCQVIVGQNVPKVYAAVCDMGVKGAGSVDEKLDAPAAKEPLTVKGVWNAILDYMSGTMVQAIPILMGGGLFRTFAVILGPQLLNVISADSAAYIFFNDIMYEASFYFLPIYLGYCAAKKLGCSPVLGMMAGGMLMAPSVIAAAGEGGSGIISVYGIEIAAANYSQSVLPIILTMPLLNVVEKFMKRHVPDVLSTIFTPFFTMIVVVPISFIVLAPIGNLIGNGIANGLFALADLGGIGILIVMAILGAFWQLFVVAGMHMPVILLAQVTIMQVGYDPFVFVSTNAAMFAVWGCAIGAFLRLRDKDEKSMAAGYVVAALVGGVTEPALFGVLMRYRRTMLGMFVGGAVSAVVQGIMGVTYYIAGGGTNFLVFLNYLPGGTQNLVFSLIGCVIAVVVAAVVTYLFGFTKEELGEVSSDGDAVAGGGVLAA